MNFYRIQKYTVNVGIIKYGKCQNARDISLSVPFRNSRSIRRRLETTAEFPWNLATIETVRRRRRTCLCVPSNMTFTFHDSSSSIPSSSTDDVCMKLQASLSAGTSMQIVTRAKASSRLQADHLAESSRRELNLRTLTGHQGIPVRVFRYLKFH